MAFKREGTDSALLQDLQKRRVSEILVSHIPEDEALLLKNGKYSCTVCPHRPVLDTIEMLAMHRKGKRHLISLTRHLSHTKWKERELEKRLQEAYVTSGARASSVDLTKPLGPASAKATKKAPRLKLMKSAPYNSCCRKKGNQQGSADAKGDDHQGTMPSTSQNPETPLVKAYIKKAQQKNSFAAAVEQSKRNNTLTSSTRPPLSGSGERLGASESPAAQSAPQRKKPASKEMTGDLTEEESREKAKAQYFLNLRMSGWKRDRDGKWVKDENAEFDSDEEEPPPFDECVVSAS
uniref:Sodium channel modifier 1 n=1 Tax=Amblyomma americanum TaxID=6943 RepID=A0A0C9RUK1_AMBAM